MFSRLKAALANAVASEYTPNLISDLEHERDKSKNADPKFPYSRPAFLNLQTMEEVKVSADHHVRPIIVPRDVTIIPFNAGYAECVNAGKSQWNEDQASVHRRVLRRPGDMSEDSPVLPYVYFGMFDGHAGTGAALAAANQLHHILHEKLIDVFDELLPQMPGQTHMEQFTFFSKPVSHDALIIGALEAAFWEMDDLLARDGYQNAGGCTAVVALLLLGKLYVSNAGDSRAVLCKPIKKCFTSNEKSSNETKTNHIENKSDEHKHNSKKDSNNIETSVVYNHQDEGNESAKPSEKWTESVESDKLDDEYIPTAVPMSYDFTPETERQRIRAIAALQPCLLGDEFTWREYAKRPAARDLGRRILYKEAFMTGWTYRTLTQQDLKIPIITGEGKRSRVMGTIGVTRGFGDHELKALNTKILIKPFLTPQPEVKILDLTQEDNNLNDLGVLIIATDGLWDVTDNDTAAKIVYKSLKQFPHGKHRYTSAAQELVAHSRGKLVEHRSWRTVENKPATIDDISVFVIPLAPYRTEYLEWKQKYTK